MPFSCRQTAKSQLMFCVFVENIFLVAKKFLAEFLTAPGLWGPI